MKWGDPKLRGSCNAHVARSGSKTNKEMESPDEVSLGITEQEPEMENDNMFAPGELNCHHWILPHQSQGLSALSHKLIKSIHFVVVKVKG